MIELAAVISELRRELEVASAAADGSRLLFDLGPIELEVEVAVQKHADGSAKVRFWVLESGVDGGTSRGTTQRLTVTLNPRLAGSDRTPYVSGESVPGER